MKILVKKIDGLKLPERAHSDDAAYDITAVSDPNIVGIKYERPTDGIFAWQKIDYIEYKTNLFISPQDEIIGEVRYGAENHPTQQFHTLIHPRSSISKKNLVLANSVAIIDHGYRGELVIRFKYIFQPEDFVVIPEMGRTRLYAILNPENVYQKGDRIAQIKASPNINILFQTVESLDETKRGTGGFGSTG